jgi:hypothetical protein
VRGARKRQPSSRTARRPPPAAHRPTPNTRHPTARHPLAQGTLAQLDSKRPLLYLDFPTGRLKLFGSLVFPRNRLMVLRAGGGDSVLAEDVFENVVGGGWWVVGGGCSWLRWAVDWVGPVAQ